MIVMELGESLRRQTRKSRKYGYAYPFRIFEVLKLLKQTKD